MTMNQKPSGRASSMPMGLLTGVVVSVGITVILSALSAKLVDMRWIGEKDIGYCAMATLLMASCFGAKTAQRRIKRQYLLVCSASAGLYFLSLMAITFLFFGGQYEAVWVTMLLITGGAVLTMLIGERRNGVAKPRKRKRYNR